MFREKSTSSVRIRLRRTPWSVVGLAVLCTALFVWPVAMIALGAFRTELPGLPADWTASRLVDVWTSGATYRTLWQSARLATTVTVVSTMISIYFAWIVARTDAPLRRLVTPIMLLVLATPSLFFAISWDMLGNPRVGLINDLLLGMTGSDAETGLVNINSWWGVVFVAVLKSVSLGYFLILGPFLAMDRSLEEASLTSGASRFKTFFRIHVPILSPAIFGAALLGFIFMLEAFDIPQIIGVPAGIRVFSTEIYAYVNATDGGDFTSASALAVLLVIFVLLLVLLQWKVLGKREFTTVSGKSYRQDPWRMGRTGWILAASILLYAVLALVLPAVQLYLGSLQPYFGIYGSWTFDNYRRILDDEQIVGALQNTFFIGTVGGLVAILFCFVVAWCIRTRTSHLTRYISGSLWMIIALPGIVLGLGVLWAVLSVPGLDQLYSTVWILFAGLFIAAVPIAMRAAEGAVVQLPLYLQEAALLSGASRIKSFFQIVLPIVRPSLLNGWILAAVLISGNLAVPVLLASPRASVMPEKVMAAYRDGDYATAAAIFGIVLLGWLVLAIVALLVRVLSHRRRRRRRAAPAPTS